MPPAGSRICGSLVLFFLWLTSIFFFCSFSLEQRVRGAAVQPERGAGQAGGAEVPPAQGKPQT